MRLYGEMLLVMGFILPRHQYMWNSNAVAEVSHHRRHPARHPYSCFLLFLAAPSSTRYQRGASGDRRQPQPAGFQQIHAPTPERASASAAAKRYLRRHRLQTESATGEG